MNNRAYLWILLAIVVALAILACKQKIVTSTPPAATSISGNVSTLANAPQSSWQAEWERTLKDAKREGVLVVHSDAQPELNAALISTMKGKFGIELELVTGRSAETNQKLLAQRKAGLFLADLYLRGTTAGLALLKPNGILDPLEPLLILHEVLDGKAWFGGKLRWADEAHYMLTFLAFPSGKIGINTSMVKTGEIKSYRDLLDTRWKGKISMNDPTVTGSGYRWFHTTARFIMDVDYMKSLAKQEPAIIRDQRVLVEWLVREKYPIAISPDEATVSTFLRVGGVPLTILTPAEGGYLTTGSGAIALINKAPHPNAARVFVNWLLTREGQTMFSKIYGAQSGRVDAPTDFLNPWSIRALNTKYIDVLAEDFDSKSEEYLKLAKEIFGPLLK